MARKGQRDSSPGDARKPYSDRGGPAGRHAETHDVRREELTNPRGPEPEGDDFAADIAPETTQGTLGGHADQSAPATGDKALRTRLTMLDADELARLAVIEPGVRLEQGGTYLDLDDPDRGPFKAIGSQVATQDNRYVAKRDVDHELWNRLVGHGREPAVERPTEVS